MLGANNLIPMEIALKIADKIRANERFAAYIVIPMWPEGVPTGAATQRILFWQVGLLLNYSLKIKINLCCLTSSIIVVAAGSGHLQELIYQIKVFSLGKDDGQ